MNDAPRNDKLINYRKQKALGKIPRGFCISTHKHSKQLKIKKRMGLEEAHPFRLNL
jgi:hypothetical protein